jgi:hypothetical protein
MKARIGIYIAAIAALLAVFALYARPQVMVAISEMVWACFQ